MERHKKLLLCVLNIVSFSLSIYFVVMGQKNGTLVRAVAENIGATNIGYVGLGIMMVGLCGLLVQLYFYNKQYQ